MTVAQTTAMNLLTGGTPAANGTLALSTSEQEWAFTSDAVYGDPVLQLITDAAWLFATQTGGPYFLVPANTIKLIVVPLAGQSVFVKSVAATPTLYASTAGMNPGFAAFSILDGVTLADPNFTGNITQTGTGTVSTGTGTVSLNGNTVIATGKKLTVSMTTALDADYTGTFGTPFISAIGGNNAAYSVVALSNVNNATGAHLVGAHTRSTGTDANAIVVNGDEVLSIDAFGADGVTYQQGGFFRMKVDGVPGANSMPMKWELATTPTSTVTPVIRWTWSADGTATIANVNIALGTGAGTQIGTATGQKLAFWGITPVAQQVLATGAAKTADDIIALLQLLGLCKQS